MNRKSSSMDIAGATPRQSPLGRTSHPRVSPSPDLPTNPTKHRNRWPNHVQQAPVGRESQGEECIPQIRRGSMPQSKPAIASPPARSRTTARAACHDAHYRTTSPSQGGPPPRSLGPPPRDGATGASPPPSPAPTRARPVCSSGGSREGAEGWRGPAALGFGGSGVAREGAPFKCTNCDVSFLFSELRQIFCLSF
jgi:hypothetical protein